MFACEKSDAVEDPYSIYIAAARGPSTPYEACEAGFSLRLG
jgi:hypothetical protein